MDSLPANATTITWSAWVYITSAEDTGTVHDTLDLLIQDDYTSTLVDLRISDNTSLYPRGTWFKLSFSWSLPSWRGQRIRFEILGQRDDFFDTSFFVDDVSLSISCSGGTPQVQSDAPVADAIVVEGESNPNAPVLVREP